MRQTQGFLQNQINSGQCLYLPLSALAQWFSRYVRTSNKPLLQLTNQLSAWNSQRMTNNQMNGRTNDLSAEDIHTIKQMIHKAIQRTAIQLSDVFEDQLLFSAIGATQIQTQTQSTQAWQRVNQLIENTIDAKKEKNVLQFSVVAITLLILMSVFAMSPTQIENSRPAPSAFMTVHASSGVDPLTIEMIQLTYQKMKNGQCQLPQAAMLPEAQRVAYLNFINHGVINIQQVESLRRAMGYVNCLYPQDLMRL